ncbi:MAG: tripartite tricarboxylate transporter substrate binding protein [Betaproteobacteria bacterium]|nr:tripartite tricarboxylate transporter substrate binding protein [Betaproteobacteria bacterium]
MRISAAVLIAFSFVAGPPAVAQEYPNRAIRMIVPFSPGGSTDILARIFGQKLHERMGQPVVVENRAGGGGHIGADFVAKAPPDGYTLLTAGIPQAIGMSLFKKVPYNMAKDLAPITLLATFPSVIAVHPSLPVRTVKDLIALAKARPGELNFGANPGSPNHLAMELLNVLSKVKTVHIPYKGAGPVVIDLVAGHLHVASMGLPSAMAMVQAGKLRPIAVTSATRSPALPDVPTVQESGVAGYEVTSWYGVFAPSGTAGAIIGRLHSELAVSLKAPDVTQRFSTLGAEASGKGPEDFGRLVREEISKWADVVKASGATAE